ncbi:MFS transporter, DHA1 family, tetracycline resistance protein [Sphingomonas gellani]|uniref:MFS transporter, DHA1 family, tetracycline resistance protein n=1 Tax=Sphingomonas gellani TaxID=1166340 RepID=A0A1H8ET63_9SPHN|nr:MFS transporter [Sphingomonas gellani]SEN22566.1 MFS transporter, DHA1 family, tetracycline resistance protein [Sphingomonas gellani]
MIAPANRAVALVLAGVAIDIIGFGIVMPVLPSLITRLGHMDLASASRVAGWMMASFAVAQFFAGPVLGNLGDRFGRRVVLVASMTAFAIDCALMAMAPTIAWLFAGRFIAGIAGATFGPASAVIADTTPPERRAASFGLLGAAFGIGFIIGPALGGLSAQWGERTPFIVAAGLAAANALLMLFFLPETLKPENRRPFRLRDAHVIGAFRPLFQAGDAAPLLVGWFLWQLGGAVYPATWAFWAAIRFGWDATAIGWSLAWVGLLSALVQVFVTKRMVARLGEHRTALIGLFSGAATLVGVAFATQGWQVYALFLIGGLGQVAWPAMNGLLSRRVDATRQGVLQGGIGSMNSVAAILGPILAAQSLAWGSRHAFDGAAFLVAAALIGTTCAIIARMVPRPQLSAEPAGDNA